MKLKDRYTKSFRLPKWVKIDPESKQVVISTKMASMEASKAVKEIKRMIGDGYEYIVREKF